MSEELKVTADRVLKAAEKCPTAKEILKELFPSCFLTKEVNVSHLKTEGVAAGVIFTTESTYKAAGVHRLIEKRLVGPYSDKGFWLNRELDWKIINDNGDTVLLPTRR